MNKPIYSMAFIKLQDLFTLILFGTALAGVVAAASNALQINYVNITERGDEVHLDAEIDYQLNDEIKEALINGIYMQFQVEVQIKSLRKWAWDKIITSVTQTHLLQYHALSKQYILENLDTGANDTFSDLDSALDYQGKIIAMRIAQTSSLHQQDRHVVQVRSHMLVDPLPLPLKMKSYFSSKWRLDSGWYEWPL